MFPGEHLVMVESVPIKLEWVRWNNIKKNWIVRLVDVAVNDGMRC
jgi:hypothetical protein